MAKSQLQMRRANLDALVDQPLPPGYDIRTFQSGDEGAWAEIMNECIGSGWTAERCRESLINQPQFEASGLFFVTYNGKPVGTACAWRKSADEREIGYVHMVGVLKEHRGKRLGRLLILKVLHYLKERGFKETRLLTDDFRLPAIKTYLNTGFEPIFKDESHHHRWADIYVKLGMKLVIGDW